MRVATVPFQQMMRGAMQTAQRDLVTTQTRIATGKKANSLAELGTDSIRTLSAHSLLTTQEAQATTAKQVQTTLSLYEVNIGNIDTVASDLRTTLVTAIGTGKTSGLQSTLDSAFQQIRSNLNASADGKPLFAGSQTDRAPFTPATLGDTAGATAATAFGNDDVRASTRVGDDIDITYGVGARELGEDLLAAFRTLAEAGTIGDEPTAAQTTALQTAIAQLDTALPKVRSINAANGSRQAQAETIAVRADDRTAMLEALISDAESADYGQLSIDLANQKEYLNTSYSVFTQIASMSLADYMR